MKSRSVRPFGGQRLLAVVLLLALVLTSLLTGCGGTSEVVVVTATNTPGKQVVIVTATFTTQPGAPTAEPASSTPEPEAATDTPEVPPTYTPYPTYTPLPTFTLAPTDTSAPPTNTPKPTVAATKKPQPTNTPETKSYPPPILVSPDPGVNCYKQGGCVFTWNWAGNLKANEYFQVQLIGPNNEHRGIHPPTKGYSFQSDEGVYEIVPDWCNVRYFCNIKWTVAIIEWDGKDPGKIGRTITEAEWRDVVL